jgi:hypothetical protein
MDKKLLLREWRLDLPDKTASSLPTETIAKQLPEVILHIKLLQKWFKRGLAPPAVKVDLCTTTTQKKTSTVETELWVLRFQ